MDKKGQNVVAGLLFLFMALVIVALTMPLVRDSIKVGVDAIDNNPNFSDDFLTRTMVLYWPVFFVIMILVIFIIILRG